jgi:hypothetical protein
VTDKQWAKIAAYVDNWWPATDFDDVNAAAYYEVLQPFDAGEVEAAVRAQLEEGSPFAPSAAQLFVAVRDVRGPEEAPTLERVLRWVGYAASNGWNERTALHFIETKSEIGMEWVKQYGYRELGQEQVNDPEHGGAVRYRLAKSLEAFTVSYERQQRSERALEVTAARHEPRQVEGALKQIEARDG